MALWGKTDNEASKPKWLSDTLKNDQTTSDLDSTIGVSVGEAQVAANRAKGIKTQGWNKFMTYTDAQGNVRTKNEILVAIGSDLTGDAGIDGNDDDTIAADPVIAITAQPQNVTIVEGDGPVTFSVTAAATPVMPLTYQWAVSTDSGSTWDDIVGATSASLVIPVEEVLVALDGNQYHVTVAANGVEPIVSSDATLTVTAV